MEGTPAMGLPQRVQVHLAWPAHGAKATGSYLQPALDHNCEFQPAVSMGVGGLVVDDA
jgi:hypothetical protein